MENSSFLYRFFKLNQHHTNVKTEIIAGFTTFLTMVYIVFVNPSILEVAGMDTKIVFVTTCLIAALGSIAMGLFANLPIAMAPAMGLNAFFAYVVATKLGWQISMGTIFWGAVGLFILTLFQVRYWLIASIPMSLRVGIGAGIGLFIALMGFHNAGIVVANPNTLMSLGDLHSPKVLLGILGFFIIMLLAAKNIHAAVLVSIVVTTTIALLIGDVQFNGVVSIPPSIASVMGEVDIVGALDVGLLGIIFSFMLVNLFDSSGTMIGVLDKVGIVDDAGKFPNMKKALYVDSLASVAGAYVGTSAVSTYVESSSGISVGGRTGLTSVVVGILFLFVIFLSPLAAIVPAYATAGALIYVGILMSSTLIKVKWEDLTEATPAFITAALMPFTYSITEGIALGFISYCVMKTFTGKIREVSAATWVVALLFVLKIVFID